MSKNAGKNVGIKNLTPFTKGGKDQPTSEAKKAGWERKRNKQKIMDLILEIQDMSLEDIDRLKKDLKANKDKHTLLEKLLLQYLDSKRNTKDFLDRHISKAPQAIEVAGKDGGPLVISTLLSEIDGKTTGVKK